MSINIEEIFIRNVPGSRERLIRCRAGIAGCGGLGSNIAVTLVRAGIGELIIADYDRVVLSNLNRQYYFLEDVGKLKTDALQDILLRINPQVKIKTIVEKLTPANIGELFSGVDIMVEAFDQGESKKWLINSWSSHHSDIPLVCGTGVAGFGKTGELKTVRIGKHYFCGDQSSDMKEGLCPARVAIVANMQANTVIEILMKGEGR